MKDTPDPKRALRNRIDNDLRYHVPTEGDIISLEAIRDRTRNLAQLIVHIVPMGREQALALSHLEIVMMMANAGITRQSPLPDGRRFDPRKGEFVTPEEEKEAALNPKPEDVEDPELVDEDEEDEDDEDEEEDEGEEESTPAASEAPECSPPQTPKDP